VVPRRPPASRLADKQAIGNVELVEGDARALAERLPEPVDVALVANTVHGVDEPERFVRQAAEALEPDGRFVVVNCRAFPRETTRIDGEPRGPPSELRLSPNETERTVREAAGALTLERSVDLPPYHYGLVFER